MNIVESINTLSNSRKDSIKVLLSDICDKKIHIFSNSRSNNLIIVVSSNKSDAGSIEYRNIRFKTRLKEITASYYEVWSKHEKDQYYLERAYFHLYNETESYLERRNDGEYILLHCDPNEGIASKHHDYKRSPHLHISCAEDPLPHSHIALNLMNLNEVLSSLENFDIAFSRAINLIRTQIIDKLSEQKNV
jgi:hypothetical protein